MNTTSLQQFSIHYLNVETVIHSGIHQHVVLQLQPYATSSDKQIHRVVHDIACIHSRTSSPHDPTGGRSGKEWVSR